MMGKVFIVFVATLCFGASSLIAPARARDGGVAGTFFGEVVSKGNYYFVLKTVLSFGSPWGGIPNNREQLEKRVWDDLILSYEAHRRQIFVEKKEVEKRISEIFKNEKVVFDWKDDPGAYAQWVDETLGASVEVFENQTRHLVQIKKLHEQILNSINPSVSEEEAFQEFLNEQNSLSVELAEFDTLEEAQVFYEKAKKDPDFWEQEAKKNKSWPREDRSFRRPGLVSLEFLMDMWKFPKEAVYGMIEMEAGDIYPPEQVYKGYGVFTVLEARRADESRFPKRRESYFNQLRGRGKRQGFKNWLKNLRKEADVQVYIDPPPELFP